MNHTNEGGLTIADYFSILKRRRWQFVVPTLLLLILAVAVAVLIPAIYRSEAIILIEQQEIPQDLVRSTVTSYADKRVQTISQRVMTTSNLGEIIKKYDLYADERKRFTLSTVVEEMREDISLEMISADVVDPRSGRPVSATIAFTLAFLNESPGNAQKVASELVSLFLNENAKERRALAKEATVFLTGESAKLGERMSTLEGELEQFKEQHSNSLPEMQSLNVQFLQSAEKDLDRNRQEIRALDERIVYLEAELVQVNPYSDLYSASGERVLSSADRLKTLETNYVSLQARYSSDHPDVVATLRELDALRQETGGRAGVGDLQRSLTHLKGELAALTDRYSADHPDVKRKQREIAALQQRIATAPRGTERVEGNQDADNPAYVQLHAKLKVARIDRQALLRTRDDLQEEVDDLKARLTAAPKVEREYRELVRDYENATLKFQEIRAKQLEAQLAESLEAKSKSERFVLIEPPLRPEEPDSPNRIAILIMGILLALFGGAAYVGLRESADDSVHGMRDIVRVTGQLPLAAVVNIATHRDIVERRWHQVAVAAGVIVLIGGSLLAVHLTYLPLDVLSVKVMRTLGI
jgi:polysaccharide biosynthesis transport protein